MNDIVSIQRALFHALRGHFADVNVVLGRDFLMDSEVEMDAIWMTPSPNGKNGVGFIVQIPELLFPKPNSLQRVREFSVGIYEERNINYTPAAGEFGGGTFTSAEDWGDQVVDFLWNWRLWRASGLVPADRAVVPDNRFQGVVGVKVISQMRQERRQPARVATPTITLVGSTVTLACDTVGAEIYFTADGESFPGVSNTGVDRLGRATGEQAAQRYVAPFTVLSGQILMVGAYAPGYLPSQITTAEIS